MFLFIFELPENGFLSFLKEPSGVLISAEYSPKVGFGVGSVFLCRITSKSQTLKGFFVNCGTLEGFLPFAEARKGTKVGDLKVLQLKREEVENKPPLFTERVKLPKWLNFETVTDSGKLGSIIKWENYLNQISNKGVQIFTNSRIVLEKLTKLGLKVLYYPTEDLLRKARFSECVREIFQKQVEFKKGQLLVEPLKTATFIDVNGNGPSLGVNLSAIPEIVRQIDIKRLGGIIVIDFLNLRTKKGKEVVGEQFKKVLEISKKSACKVLGFTRGNHFELNCLKKGEPLTEVLTEKQELGKFKFWDIFALEILEKISPFRGTDVRIKMHPLRKDKVLQTLKGFYIGKIEPVWDCFINPDRFEILL